jgi:uncharacterized lipoprotein YmbA
MKPPLTSTFPGKLQLWAGGFCLVLVSCNIVPPAQPDSTRFFILSAPQLPAGDAAIASEAKLRIGFNNLTVADYLKSPSLLVRSHVNELDFSANNRWAEPIEAGISRILRASLSASPKVALVTAQPFPFEAARDYDIAVDVLQCEGSTAGSRPVARFSAMYQISTAGTNPRLVARKLFVAPAAPWDGHNYGRLAALLGEEVLQLGREIVAALPNSP